MQSVIGAEYRQALLACQEHGRLKALLHAYEVALRPLAGYARQFLLYIS